MRKVAILIAATAAFASVPAAAQLGGVVGGGVNANVGAGVGVDTGRVVGNTVGTVDRTVDRTERTTNGALDRTRFTLVTSNQVTVGTEVRDSRGQRIGTVSRIDGNAAVVVRGQDAYHVPMSSLYRRTSGSARELVTAIPRAQLTGHANTQANAHSAAHVGH
jgi:hypothetical protein